MNELHMLFLFWWQVTDEIYQHIDVREEGKTNAFSLGNSLWIGTEEFEDLDEIIARQDAEDYIDILERVFS